MGNEAPAPAAEPAPAAVIEQRFNGAVDAFRGARYAEAGSGFAWVVEHDPTGPQAGPAQWNLTRSHLRGGDGNAALNALDKLLRQYGDYLGAVSPSLREGLEHLEHNQLAPARAALERMVGEEPDSEFVPLAYALIARIHWAHGEPFEMVRAFGRMFASVKDPVPAYQTLARQLERYADGDKTVTQTFGDLAEHGEEGFRDIYQYLAARTLLEQDRFAATREALEELRRRHPDGDFTHIVDLEHAWNFLRNGQPAEALAIFQRLEQSAAPDAAGGFDTFFDIRKELPMGIARCHLALRQYDDAIRAFDRALAQDPKGIWAVENRIDLAFAYEGLNRFDKAAEILRGVIRDHPDEPKLWAVKQQLARIEERGRSVIGQQ